MSFVYLAFLCLDVQTTCTSDFSFYSLILVYEQYRSIEPWLQTKEGKAEGQAEFLQTKEDRAKLDGMVRHHETRDLYM